MKTQDNYPYDPTLIVLSNIFHKVGSNSFYINFNCVLATKKIITIGKEYIIFDNTTDTGIKMSDVILVGCYYRDGIIYLIVRDIRSQRVFTIHNSIGCPKKDCTWLLIDVDYFIKKMDDKAINQYCGHCLDKKKKPNAEINHKSDPDDLLEFEF
jgi:hypothetical protein